MNNKTVCDKFHSTILEGQLCFTLDIDELKKYPPKSGLSNGLLLLLDPNPYQLIGKDMKFNGSAVGSQNFKVFIKTLAQYTSYGPGSYAMDTLKKMAGTKSFKQLPNHQKRCMVHDREECQTQKYLEKVHKECECTLWALQTDQVEI